jgi:hypothetical protein
VFPAGSVSRLYHKDQRDKPNGRDPRAVNLQSAVGRQTRRRSSQTVAPGGGMEGGESPIVESRCISTPSQVVRWTPASEDRSSEHRS